MDTKFYVNAEANDDDAYVRAMDFASELSNKDSDIDRIILLVNTKQNTGWFQRIFDDQMVKKLFNGIRFNDSPALFKIETLKTYTNFKYGSSKDIVITCGLDSKDILIIDDFYSAKYVIAMPWLISLTEKWIKTWNAIEISGNQNEDLDFSEPSCIVKQALNSLSRTINMSTGINHPSDNNRAKTYILALHKYEDDLDADIVGSYLVRQLNWDTKHAKDVEKLISTLNSGKYFQGGERKGLQNYYKKWKTECA